MLPDLPLSNAYPLPASPGESIARHWPSSTARRWVAAARKVGARWLLLATCLVACGGGSASLNAPPTSSLIPGPSMQALLGANLPAISDYSRTPVYVDVVRQARGFGPVDRPWDDAPVPVDPDGWPSTDFGVFLISAKGAFAGTYHGAFTGQAELGLVASYDTRLADVQYDPATNRTTFAVVRGSSADVENMALTFRQTRRTPQSAPGTGITTLQIVRPGYALADAPLFTNEFLTHIARFQTLRFMDWLHTNNNATVSWEARTRPDTHFASRSGVPWEHIVALARQTHKDIWINVPTLADDDYVRRLAELLHTGIPAEQGIYLEYSNELWNPSFWQFNWNKELAKAEVQSQPNSVLAFDGSTDPNVWLYRRIAKRSKEISDIFRQVFGDEGMRTRIRPVFASQAVQPYVSKLGLDFIAAVYGTPSRYFHALAISDYFGTGDPPETDGRTVDQILQAMDESVDAMPRKAWFETNLALARRHGLTMLAYEGGSDTFGPLNIAAKRAASLDPRMRALCQRHLLNWFRAGGGLFVWYTAGAGSWDTPFGSWELTTDLANDDAPKLQCIDAVRQGARPTPAYRNVAPGTFSALSYVDNPGPPFAAQSFAAVRYQHPGNPPVDYLVYAPNAGDFSLVLSAGTAVEGNTVDVHVNGEAVATQFELRRTPGFETPMDNVPIPIRLTQGFNALRITTRFENTQSGRGAGGYWPATLRIE